MWPLHFISVIVIRRVVVRHMCLCLVRSACEHAQHRRRKVLNMGGGGGGGQGSEYWGGEGKGGGKLFAGCKQIGAPAPNQWQITTFLILKTDNIAKL